LHQLMPATMNTLEDWSCIFRGGTDRRLNTIPRLYTLVVPRRYTLWNHLVPSQNADLWPAVQMLQFYEQHVKIVKSTGEME
jgi:hypothetical protein